MKLETFKSTNSIKRNPSKNVMIDYKIVFDLLGLINYLPYHDKYHNYCC